MMLNQYFIMIVRALGAILGIFPWIVLLYLWIGMDGSSFISVDIGLEDLVKMVAWSSPGLAIFTLSLYLERLRKRDDPFESPPEANLR